MTGQNCLTNSGNAHHRRRPKVRPELPLGQQLCKDRLCVHKLPKLVTGARCRTLVGSPRKPVDRAAAPPLQPNARTRVDDRRSFGAGGHNGSLGSFATLDTTTNFAKQRPLRNGVAGEPGAGNAAITEHLDLVMVRFVRGGSKFCSGVLE